MYKNVNIDVCFAADLNDYVLDSFLPCGFKYDFLYFFIPMIYNVKED